MPATSCRIPLLGCTSLCVLLMLLPFLSPCLARSQAATATARYLGHTAMRCCTFG